MNYAAATIHTSPASPEPPLVSVCIPVYNGEQYIGETILSVLDQQYPNIEIIVQDNASTDGTLAAVHALAALHPQITVFRNDHNVGMAPNWNIAISKAKGDFVLLMSADDLIEKDYLARCLGAFREHAVDVVTANHFWFKDGKKRPRRKYVHGGVYRHFCSELILFNPFPIVFALFKRDTIERMLQKGKLFNELFPYTCDYELLLRLALSGASLYYLDEPLASYRLHDANLSRQIMRMHRQAALAVLLHRAELRRQCPASYRFTLVRFSLRVIRNYLRFRRFDKRLFTILWNEVIHAHRGSQNKKG